jgi:hypothetical protein
LTISPSAHVSAESRTKPGTPKGEGILGRILPLVSTSVNPSTDGIRAGHGTTIRGGKGLHRSSGC